MPSVFYFGDVPIYRLPEKDYYAQREEAVQDALATGSRDPSIQKHIRAHTEAMYGGPWTFNEIVGYIRMHFLGSQIRGEYFRVDAKRIVRTRKKVLWMIYHKLAPEKEIPRDASSANIFAVVMAYIEACRRELPERYIDSSDLETVGPYIDWRAMWDDYLTSLNS